MSGLQFDDERCPSNGSVADHFRILRCGSTLEGTDRAVIEVENSGPGIDSMAVDRVFKPFLRSKPQGMGLGLSICKIMIESHGGRLMMMPAVHRGTMFRIVLPRWELGSQ